jgi:adenosine deaminase
MAQRKVAVEICLTSNDVILGVEGANHPLQEYLAHGVPVALATDDQGVSRSDMTHEYLRAVETYKFSYTNLKRMARESLEHSFLAGESLWRPGGDFQAVAACTADRPDTEKNSAACQKFLDGSERARVQWELEGAFAKFERKY